jgi:hypothetical protein
MSEQARALATARLWLSRQERRSDAASFSVRK